MRLTFTRLELAGALGDLGTLLPLAMGAILVCGVDGGALFLMAGLFYALSGLYFRIPTPVQPMKVIVAYAIARSLAPGEIQAAGLWVGVILLGLAASGAITWIGRVVPKSVIRGLQLSVGVMLMTRGISFILGTSAMQAARGAAEPYLAIESIGPVPVGIVLGLGAVAAILLLRDNRYAPAGLVVVVVGAAIGAALGAYRELTGFSLGLHLPSPLAGGFPDAELLVVTLTTMALPQLPMTLGNAVVAQSDLAKQYFGERAKRTSPRALATSMGLANVAAWWMGGMPMCHGSGGLAAHYRFGARTAGANLMIGGALILVGLFAGSQATSLMAQLPLSVLGALLAFAGLQLALTLLGTRTREDLAVALVVLAVALATNLAWGFAVGLGLAYLFRHARVRV